MGDFHPVAGLDEMVALMVADDVRKIANDVRDTAKRLAPSAKTWVNQGDGKVRPTHIKAMNPFNALIPENLRFKLDSMDWDMDDEESNHLPANTWMQHPKDWTSGAVANILDCRCHADVDKDAIRKRIRTGPTRVDGAVVRVTVSAYGNRIVASEFGEHYDVPSPPAEGLHWMARAAAMVGAKG